MADRPLRPRPLVDDWTAFASVLPPSTVAIQDEPGREAEVPPADGRFRAIRIEDLVGAPRVDDRWGGLSLSPDGREVAFAWDRGGVAQIHVAPLHGERIYELTGGDDRAVWPRWSPDGAQLAFLRDRGGDERFQIWCMDRQGKGARALTDLPAAGHRDIAWSPDGRRLAFVSNSGGGRYRVETIDLRTGERRPLTDGEHGDESPRWSPDGRWILFASRRGPDPRSVDLFVVPSGGGEALRIETRGGEPGRSADGVWSPDGRSIAFATDASGTWEIALVRLTDELERSTGGVIRPRVDVLTRSAHGSTSPVWRPDGRGIVYARSRDAQVSLRRVFVASHADSPVADVPGVHTHHQVGPDSETLVYVRASARRPHGVWLRRQRSIRPEALTDPSEQLDPAALVEPTHIRYPSADGLEIPALLYRPHPEARRPGPPAAIVHIHGGPRGQHLRGWDDRSQWFAHRGYVVLAPNVRGSIGYGRAFEEANRGDWGGGDLRDIVAGVRWLVGNGLADKGRIGAFGASYGGYLTTYALAREPELFAAGVSYVGVMSWLTLHERTRGDLREYLERELGDPREAADLYRERSPLTHARHITAPLLILQGANDPRVPLHEAEQMVEALRGAGATVDHYVYPDQGHGARTITQRIDLLRRATEWFDAHLTG